MHLTALVAHADGSTRLRISRLRQMSCMRFKTADMRWLVLAEVVRKTARSMLTELTCSLGEVM